MMFKLPVILSALLVTFCCSAAPAQEGNQPKTHKPKIDLPVPERAWGNPVAAVSTQGWMFTGRGWRDPESSTRPRVIVTLWADGHIVWSENSIEGGPPYFEATLDPLRVEKLLKNLEERGVFADPSLSSRPYFGPDSTWSAIVVVHEDKSLNMQSWHELYNRDRGKVLANEPKEYQNFRRIWSDVKEAMLELIPKEGGEPSDVSFTLERVSVEQP